MITKILDDLKLIFSLIWSQIYIGYFHIFFNGDKKETKNKNEIIKGDDIEEIKIIIDC